MARRPATPQPLQREAIEAAIGYSFGRPDLLQRAMTHASTTGRGAGRASRHEALTTQRLEFLGDRVLALVMALLLLERYPEASEGDLTNRSQVLVSAVILADIAGGLAAGCGRPT